jgi:glycosyltransferase involved in cell wall biosynthesis
MRILFVVHQFAPRFVGGTEIAVATLAAALARMGHHVRVLTPEFDIGHPIGRVVEDSVEVMGVEIPVTRVVTHRLWSSLASRIEDPRFGAIAIDALDSFRPDVLHVHHLLGGSLALWALARARGVRTVVTLHDFFALCPQGGQMLFAGERCTDARLAPCASCLARRPVTTTFTDTAIRTVAARTPRLLREAARPLWPHVAALRPVTGGALTEPAAPTTPGGHPDVSDDTPVTVRARALAALGDVDAVVSPSGFLKDMFTRHGLEHPAFHVVENAVDFPARATAPADAAHGSGQPLKVLFIGAPSEAKGLEALVAAFDSVPVSAATLDVHTQKGFNPSLVESLQSGVARGARQNVRFFFDTPRADIVTALEYADLLCLPSLWWENAPVTLREAALAGRPAIVGGHGGMAEFVTNADGGDSGGWGWHIDTTPAALARDLPPLLARLSNDRAVLHRATRNAWAVGRRLPKPAEVAETHLRLYRGETVATAAAPGPVAEQAPTTLS